jgi:hypothetical protein
MAALLLPGAPPFGVRRLDAAFPSAGTRAATSRSEKHGPNLYLSEDKPLTTYYLTIYINMLYSAQIADAASSSPRSFMPRRQAVLLTLPPAISNSSLLWTLLQKSEAHHLSFQPVAHSLQKHLGWRTSPSLLPYFITSLLPPLLSPLSATLTADLRVLPVFGRSCPPATSLDATLTKTSAVTPLGATLTKNTKGAVHYAS